MAVGEIFPGIVVDSSGASSIASSSPLVQRREQLIKVATENSSAFICFPRSKGLKSSIVPLNRPRASLSSTRLSSATTDVETTILRDQQRSKSHHRSNPILENPLLNHRKEQSPATARRNPVEFNTTIEINLTNKHRTRKTSRRIATIEQKNDETTKSQTQIIRHLGQFKYDFIVRWLNDVRRENFLVPIENCTNNKNV